MQEAQEWHILRGVGTQSEGPAPPPTSSGTLRVTSKVLPQGCREGGSRQTRGVLSTEPGMEQRTVTESAPGLHAGW